MEEVIGSYGSDAAGRSMLELLQSKDGDASSHVMSMLQTPPPSASAPPPGDGPSGGEDLATALSGWLDGGGGISLLAEAVVAQQLDQLDNFVEQF